MKRQHLALLLIGLFISAAASAEQSAPDQGCTLEARIVPNQQAYRLNEPILISITLVNLGTSPCYVPANLKAVSRPNGGFSLHVEAMPPATAVYGAAAGDPGPGVVAKRDIPKEISSSWIRLAPQHLYGQIIDADFVPTRRGTFKVGGSYHPPYFSSDETKILKSLGIVVPKTDLSVKAFFIKIR